MANRRMSVVVQDEILRLKRLEHSKRQVAKILGIHRNTVSKYWDIESSSEYEYIPNWTALLDWEYVKSELENNTPLKILYEELNESFSMPSYSSFCRYCSKNIKTNKAKIVVRVPRSPGESLETDYSGDSIDLIIPATGEIVRPELFVSTMSYSSHIYAEFSPSQKLHDWIDSHNRMFKFYGGVPKYEITDNLKSAVTRTDKYDPDINRTFYDMARHYDLTIDPADPRSPQQKPRVEKAVDILQQDFFPRVRHQTFTSIAELNRVLWDYLKIKNAEVMKDRGQSRDYFFEQEKHLLKKLPENPYELFYWKKAKVHPDCCFTFKKNFYSVPHRYVGKEIELKFNQRMIYAYYKSEQIKCHTTAAECLRHQYKIDPNDYPEKRLIDSNFHIQHALKEAKTTGANTFALIKRLLNQDRFPLKKLRKIQAIMGLKKKFSDDELDYGCEMALELGRYSYRFINSCAKNYSKPKDLRSLEAPQRQLELVCLQGGKS